MYRTQTTHAALCLLMILAISAPAEQQKVYSPSAMPRVDMHTHMDAKTQYAKSVEAMDQWGGTISISLAGLFWVKDNNGSNASPASVRQIPTNDIVYVREKLNDRILFVPGAFTIPSKGIWWSVDEIKAFKAQGFVGLKLWPHGKILSSKIPKIHEQLDEAGRQGMPLIGYHTGDPGNTHSNHAAFPKYEDDTIKVVEAHPQTTFIFAHGLFMLQSDAGMEKLAGIFDKHPNVFVDLSYVHNARQPANYTVAKAREFYIKYRDRILFGTDVFGAGAKAEAFLKELKLLETAEVADGMHRGPQMEGLNLPDTVLNHIYYWNAARLIPRVRQVLEARDFKIGYELGTFKFDRLPPDVGINKLTFVSGKKADLTGTLGSVTESLTVEIAGKVYEGIDNLNGTWKLPADRMAALPAGTYDVKMTARNSIGIVRTDSTTNELTVVAAKTTLDDFMNSINTRTLDQRSAADVINEGKQLPSEIVKSVHVDKAASAARPANSPVLKLMGNRFLTFSTIVRVNQIETSREETDGSDESGIHGPEEARVFRDAVEKGWPGARITWGFSWLALKDQRPNYLELKKLVVSYHEKYGDEITFVPGGYFANMYNSREQVNRDLHDGLQMVSEMVGAGYRPQCVIAGFLSAENLRFLAENEGIHVCQGNIWSQYAVDNGDGEGSLCYPYYPSREHFCKPAQGKEDLIDCVNLDGWTVDFLCARYAAPRMIQGIRCGSRQGVGPIETLLRMGTEQGTKAMLASTAAHFDTGFELNNFAWVTSIWELGLVEGRKIYGYKGRNGMEGLVIWLSEMRRRWPEAKCITHGEFGMLWREQFKNNDNLNYRFVQRGSGIGGSDAEMEIRWFMNKDFRLALLRNWQNSSPEKLIDFTRYDLPAREPADPTSGQHNRNWSLLNRLNQKGVRPQDQPIPVGQLTSEEQTLIKRRYPELIKGNSNE